MIPSATCVPSPSVPNKVSSLCVRLFLLLAAFAGLLPATAGAQVTFEPNWVLQSPTNSPPVRYAAGMAYDAAHGKVVLFGGLVPSNDPNNPSIGTFLGDTWVWDGTNWTQLNPANSPSARGFAGMVYDEAHHEVVLFGGSNGGVLNDTWLWDGTNWAQLNPANSPPGRASGDAMAYDAAHQQVVLFGGDYSSGFLGDTWVWNGTTWAQSSPANNPPPDGLGSMAYDAAQQQVIQFGGQMYYLDGTNETWAWDGSNWTQQSPANKPSSRSQQVMAYDAAYGQIVLFGGADADGNVLGDTWLWDGTNWTQESPANSPAARFEQRMAYDTGHGQVVLFGGADSNGNPLNDTWVWGQGDFGSQPIGSTSAKQYFNFLSTAPSPIGSVAVLTQGAPNLDFKVGPSGCQGNETTTTCSYPVTFTPTVAGLREGEVVIFSGDGTGTQLASTPIFGIGTGPQIAYGPGTATAIAPTASSVPLGFASGVAVDGAGDLFISDDSNSRVLEVPAGGGATVAITPTVNGLGLDGFGGLAVDGAGNLFIADGLNHRVVEVPAGGGAAFAVSASGLSLGNPAGVAVDGAGNLFIADFSGSVWAVPAGGGPAIEIDPTVDGKSLHSPNGVAVDGAGDLFIADLNNNRVVEVPAGGAAIAIDPTVNGNSLSFPEDVAVDAAGDLFIADSNNARVVEVPAGGGAAVAIAPTVNSLALSGVVATAVDGAGDLFIADAGNNRVVEVQRSQPPTLNFPTSTPLGTTDSTDGTQTVHIVNIGTSDLNFAAALSYPADFSEPSGDSTACISSTSLSAGQECDVPVEFTPVNFGSLSEDVTLTDNNLNVSGAQQSIPVTGTATAVPTLSLSASPSTSVSVGTQVTFKAALAGLGASPAPSGTVTFTINGSSSSDCPAVAVSSLGVASCTTASLLAPADVITATYSGDPNYTVANPATLTENVSKATASTVLTPSPLAPYVNQLVTFSATVLPPGGSTAEVQPTGNVTFKQGSTVLCSAMGIDSATQIASCSYAFTGNATGITITATYSGDQNFAAGAPGSTQISVATTATTTSVVSTPNPSAVNQPVIFKASVTPAYTAGTGMPTGTVVYTNTSTSTQLCSVTLSNGVVPICKYAFTAQGSDNVTATFTSGDSNFTGSASAADDQGVGPGSTSVTLTSSPLPSSINQQVTITAVVGYLGSGTVPTGTITFTDTLTSSVLCAPNVSLVAAGSLVSATCQTTFTTAGIHTISAAYSGDANFNKSTSVLLNQVVNAPALTITWGTPTAITYPTPLSGTQLNATATVAGNFVYSPPLGTVLKAGLQTLTATFTPTDTTDYSVTVTQVKLQVNQGTPVVSWSPSFTQIGSKLGAAQLDATANVPGKFAYTPSSGTEVKNLPETLKVVFTPTDTVNYTIVDKSVSLGMSEVRLSPSSINFGTVKLDSITTKDVTVTNLGPEPVTIYTPAVTVPKEGDSKEFAAFNLCPKSLAAHKSCTVKVEYVAGPFYNEQSSTLSVATSSPGSPQTVSLTALTKKP